MDYPEAEKLLLEFTVLLGKAGINADATLTKTTLRMLCPRDEHAPFVNFKFGSEADARKIVNVIIANTDLNIDEDDTTTPTPLLMYVTNEETEDLCGQWAWWIEPIVTDNGVRLDVHTQFYGNHLPQLIEIFAA